MSGNSNLMMRLPLLQSKWWTLVLALSLMLNLLVAGALLGRNMRPRPIDIMIKNNIAQLMPGKFFSQLPQTRRKEILGFLRDYRDDLKSLRESAQINAMKLADSLDNFDAASIKTIIDSFTTGNANLVMKRGAVVNDLIARLTPDERKNLAKVIRERDAQRKKTTQ